MAGLGAILVLGAALAGGAVDDPGMTRLEPAFRHTLQITGSDGRVSRMWLDRDGRYRGHGRRASSGVWRMRGDELCFTQRRPIPIPVPFCTPLVEGDVGTRWNARSATGDRIVIEIVRGR
ncbi:hypothetical protein [Brevundimonas sp.]|uniref:hypothetical protein n=1 Tax=Brevundimonas sp. TaxID=1871086 RepID=UPI001D7D1E23|nr:hypothetical protein [Brevundimonas sp.]MBA4000619.1 hypothetical protein [Brevundimonas sp.]